MTIPPEAIEAAARADCASDIQAPGLNNETWRAALEAALPFLPPPSETRYASLLELFGKLQHAALNVAEAIDAKLDTAEEPLKYTAPFGALAELRRVLSVSYGLRALPFAQPSEDEVERITQAILEQARPSTNRAYAMTKDSLIVELVEALELARGYIECSGNLAKVDAVLEMAKGAHAVKHWPMQQLSDADCEILFDKWKSDDGEAATAICRLLADRTFILAQSDDWQPIATAPKNLVAIIATSTGKVGQAINIQGKWTWENEVEVRDEVTHWRLLPPPPSKQG